MTLAKVVRKGSYQGVSQWGISTSSEITPSRATARKWADLENARARAAMQQNNDSHYIGGSGEYGCRYDSCGVYRTLQDAINGLADTFNLGRTRKAELKRSRHLDLNPGRDGADYCEIQHCNCAEPWIHDEGMTEEDWKGEDGDEDDIGTDEDGEDFADSYYLNLHKINPSNQI
jgi:hypothetical protein